jgi:hypothetical protein
LNRREILTKLGFEVDEKPLAKVEGLLGGIKRTLQVFAVAEVVRGIADMTERFAHFAEELHIAAESAGITVEKFQQLAFAAKQSAVSQEELGMSMARLSRHLYDARRGGEEANKAFMDAGFTQDQIAGFKTGSDVMAALADRFKDIQDPIKKQALAMELMGRGSVNMVGFLSQGSAAIDHMGMEASKLGIVLSGAQVNALVKLEHALQKVWAIIEGVGKAIAATLAPAITGAIDYFLKLFGAASNVLKLNWQEWAYKISFAAGYVVGVIEGVIKSLVGLFKGGDLKDAMGDFSSSFDDIKAIVSDLAESFKPLIDDLISGLGPAVNIVIDGLKMMVHLLALAVHGWREIFDLLKETGIMDKVVGFISATSPLANLGRAASGAKFAETAGENMGAFAGAGAAAGIGKLVMNSTTHINMGSADPKEVAKRTEEAHANAHSRTMREAGRAFYASEAY